jgi:hypothetical protein
LQNLANNNFEGNISKLADKINNVFASVSSDLEPLQEVVLERNPDPIPDRFIITPKEEEEQLSNIKISKAMGPDYIPNWILKELSSLIANPICAIFNSSLRESFTPTIWKRADVVPIPKVNPVTNLTKDLRPISLTPVLAKLMEKYPVQHLRTACPNIDPNQYGAINGSSTTHALLKILQPVYEATDDNKRFVRLLLIDFSKAFDHIDHNKLLEKIQ